MKKNMSKEFLMDFFKDSKIEDKNGVLTISEVSSDFEKFVGKPSPYKFVFDVETHSRVQDSELIMQGSYFLLAVRDYLIDKGQTSLLKSGAGLMYEFSFISTYQYLNDKKQAINKILIKNGKVMDNLSKVIASKGDSSEISNLDASGQYNIAKKKLGECTKKDIKSIKVILKKKLEKELMRVRGHYSKQIKEKDEEVETCENKIKMLQSKLRHTSYERDRNIITRMIRESTERLEMLKKRSYKERLKEEEIFHVKDEIEKHALTIKNSLINLTVYY